MTIFQAMILGAVQGITEFFPISSSGHLVALQAFFGIKEPRIAFDIFLHLGTLVSVLIFFRKDIMGLFGNDRRLFFLLIVASMPTFAIAVLFKDAVEPLFASPKVVGYMLLLTGAWLIAARVYPKRAKDKKEPGIADSIMIGIAQGIAIIPGISRSGATIASGILSGVEKASAVRFSMLLSIPAIAGASVFKAAKISAGITGQESPAFILGGLTAMLVGLAALSALLKLVKNNKLHFFGIYCIAAGLVIMLRFWG